MLIDFRMRLKGKREAMTMLGRRLIFGGLGVNLISCIMSHEVW